MWSGVYACNRQFTPLGVIYNKSTAWGVKMSRCMRLRGRSCAAGAETRCRAPAPNDDAAQRCACTNCTPHLFPNDRTRPVLRSTRVHRPGRPRARRGQRPSALGGLRARGPSRAPQAAPGRRGPRAARKLFPMAAGPPGWRWSVTATDAGRPQRIPWPPSLKTWCAR